MSAVAAWCRALRESLVPFEEDLAPGTFGILEPKEERLRPVSLAEADVVLVPLLAWDEKGQRLGYGAGYFDRALAGARRVTKVGLGLESQRLPSIPTSKRSSPSSSGARAICSMRTRPRC